MGYVVGDWIANRQELLSTRSWEFSAIPDDLVLDDVNVPFYFWPDFAELEYCTPIRRTSVCLNRVRVDFNGVGEVEDYMSFFEARNVVDIKLYKSVFEHVKTISIVTNPVPGSLFGADTPKKGYSWIYYGVTIDGHYDQIRTYDMQSFVGVPGLRHVKPPKLGTDDVFSYGLSSNKYRIRCRGYNTGRDCYALLCGTWAILLTDDMQFDSLALLRGVDDRSLDVSKFVHTINPIVMKAIALMG